VDDVRGWNFIGGRDGKSVHQDTYEVTRLYVQCVADARGGTARSLSTADRERCDRVTREYEQKRAEARQMLEQLRAVNAAMSQVVPLLKRAAGVDSLTTERVATLRPVSSEVQQARDIYLQLASIGITPSIALKAEKQYESQVQFGFNPSFDPRPLVGDNYANVSERRYGNTDVTGPDAEHGTHVAGIIGAVRDNGAGIDGIAPAVRIMAVRAVPDGDERDKDVANAIRYAVDNGAQIINMSFGKGYSPQKGAVDDAVKYADSKGVLIVHAAGNDGENSGEHPSYPTPMHLSGGQAQHWIEVGASSWKGGDSLAAPFSNYSGDRVDVFAPGVDILSTVPGGKYEPNSGTSMAAPVVSGLAALLMAYYPDLTAADVKRVVLESATRRRDLQVIRPGATSDERVTFGSLSVTGAIVNAYEAIRMAERLAGAKP
jgi:subtilisin family serine protease